jgi:hypothetical protein
VGEKIVFVAWKDHAGLAQEKIEENQRETTQKID